LDLSSCRVLVTPTSYGKNDRRLHTELETTVGEVVYNPFARPLTSEELQTLLPACHGYIAGLDHIDRAALDRADQLKVIARYGVGVDRVDLAAAAEKSIIVTNTPFANSVSVAELTIGLMLSLARSIPALGAETRVGRWPRQLGITLEGKAVGVIGMGSIGKHVLVRLRGFGCVLMAHDPVPDVAFAAEHGVVLAPLEDVLCRADFVSLHLPVLPSTREMVNSSFLARMKAGSYLINTSRGELIDEAALLEALQSGHLRGAALDVFAREPPGENPLLALPQVVVTPHCGSHTDGATDAMGWGALRDCLAVLRGEQPLHRVV
jgi:D-3-phosphoglycerate dehydrogenase / 2-oxoglutarate reductase